MSNRSCLDACVETRARRGQLIACLVMQRVSGCVVVRALFARRRPRGRKIECCVRQTHETCVFTAQQITHEARNKAHCVVFGVLRCVCCVLR